MMIIIIITIIVLSISNAWIWLVVNSPYLRLNWLFQVQTAWFHPVRLQTFVIGEAKWDSLKIPCRKQNYPTLYPIGWFDLSICFGQLDPIFVDTVLVWATIAISHLFIFSAKYQLSTASTNSLSDLGVSRNPIGSLSRSIEHYYFLIFFSFFVFCSFCTEVQGDTRTGH